MSNYLRVIRGANMVLEHLMASNRTAFGEKYKRASYHLSELSKIANEVWAESKVHSAAGSKNNNVNTSAHSAANITNMDNSADSSRSNSDSAANHGKVANIATNGFVQNLTNINSQVSQTIGRHSSDQQHRSSVSGDSSIGHRADATTISSSNNETVSATSDSSLRGKDLSSAATASSTAGRTATKGMTQEELDLIGFSSIANDKEAKQKAEEATQVKKPVMRERAVPSTQLGRLFGFGSLAARMALDVAMDSATSAFSGNSPERKSRLSDENAERLAEALCRMRGAALKLGQMLSLQDEASMPPALAKALDRVKQSADYMPKRQLEKQLTTQLGENWREKVAEFDPIPIAAASIGQVHRAKLHDGTEVAMKIQYPGVAESIDSDLRNLKALVSMTNMLPPGLFIDQIITVVSRELKEECDYRLEADCQMKYRNFILNDPILRKHTNVPEVYPELSTSRILTSRFVAGESIDKAAKLPQNVRNAIARTMLILTIRELFEWNFIQSDPNFANFLYDNENKMINLIDFGAARKYEKDFVDGYMKLVWAAANKDRDTIVKVSTDLKFLTGDESSKFIDAHVDAGMVVGEPFLTNEPFDFANSKLTVRLSKHGDTFMNHRLTPPPTEAYSLHRKLAGAFLLCIKLKANIRCRDILENTWNDYTFGGKYSK